MSQFRDKPKKNSSKKIEMENGKKSRDEWAHNLHNTEGVAIEIMEVTEAPPDHEYCDSK